MQSSLRHLPAWRALEASVRDGIVRLDFTDPVLFRNLSDGSAQSLEELSLQLGGSASSVEALRELWIQCMRPHFHTVSRLASFTAAEAVVHVHASSIKRSASAVSQAAEAKRANKGVHASWPTNLRRMLSRAEGPNARANVEKSERDRWVTELRKLVEEAGLPINHVAEAGVPEEAVWSGLGQGLRARTLRRKVRGWGKASRFFALSHGHPWPQSVASVLG